MGGHLSSGFYSGLAGLNACFRVIKLITSSLEPAPVDSTLIYINIASVLKLCGEPHLKFVAITSSLILSGQYYSGAEVSFRDNIFHKSCQCYFSRCW